jgi:outer membrane protein TolC
LQSRLANVQLQYTQRKLLADFESAYTRTESAAAQVDTLRKSSSLAEQSRRLTLLRYKAGEASALEVVDAQNTVARENNSLIDAEAAYATAVAELQAVTGPF